jgi:very-short-patch-repair endonuclease
MESTSNHCFECNELISIEVFNYSTQKFNAPLCMFHQDKIRETNSTVEEMKLYFALRLLGVQAQLKKNDGYKTIDIAIPEVKVNIEVDGFQHNTNHKQAFQDLKRTYYSFLKGYITFRIPNSLVRNHLEETAYYITEMLNEKNKVKWKKHNN